ncbi:MAG: Flp pilus assembly complex ATPase component TadA [Candidatus Omnitrophica bacterium]|nr:Flp pilus assembly complex ATPase component TadA [Candidatus Omnitrophota bacterium]
MVQKPSILVVESDLGFANLLRLRLEEAGYRVHMALSGREVLIRAIDETPDLLIVDAKLPDKSGLDLFAELKEIAKFRHTPVLFITDRQACAEEFEVGGHEFFTRPYDPKSLLSRVRQALQRKMLADGGTIEVPGEAVLSTEEGFPSPQVPESVSASAPAQSESWERVNLREVQVDAGLLKKVPFKFVQHYKVFPVKMEEGVLTLAVKNPGDRQMRDDLRQYLGMDVQLVAADENEIEERINSNYGVGAETVEGIWADSGLGEDINLSVAAESDEDIAKMAGDASIVRLVNQILVEAQRKGATDIHIEPYAGKLSLRYRIDGVLRDAKVPDNIIYFLPAIISRIKIMAGLDIVERRLPQDGRAKVKILNQMYDLRVSTLPTQHGESMVIRVLPMTMLFDLAKLGFSEHHLKIFEDLIRRPHGVLLVTGPTGSGKTTTLYTALSKIKRDNEGAKILTIEDPIEYELQGITQTQVNPEIDLTFARSLRSMLRHDPDIMMVGEIRDLETAEIGIRMALTGHLLFSTLHTNDAASGVARLIDMGVEPYLVASSVEAFIAQRLVRRICEDCKVEYHPTERELGKLGHPKDLDICFKGEGCDECNSTGYRGRTGIHEILVVDDTIKKLINEKVPSEEIKKAAVAAGMKTLWDDGKEKIRLGITTVEEVLRMTTADSNDDLPV